MINFFRTRKLRLKCRSLAVEWIKNLVGATEGQAVEFIESSPYFYNDLWFDLGRTIEYNTDLALVRTLYYGISVELDCVSEGLQIYEGLKPGFIGIRSARNYNQLLLRFSLGAKYTAHLLTKIEDQVPDGFLTSVVLNTEINFLKFVSNFYEWKVCQIVTSDGQELPLETYFAKLREGLFSE